MPKTILQYISASHMGGAEQYFLRLIEALRNAGHRVIIVVIKNSPLHHELSERGFEVHAWPKPSRRDLVTLCKLCLLIRREKVEVVNAHLTRATRVSVLAGKITGIPIVARVAAAGDKVPPTADYFIAVAEGVKQQLIEEGIPTERIRVIYNGINLAEYSDPPAKAKARNHLGLPPDAKVIAVVANLRERKGHRFLLQALHDIEPQIGPIHALFAGEGDEEPALRTLATSLGLDKRIQFLGYRRDVKQIVAAADVFVLPSFKEGLSNAVMEAMALCRPVIATNIAGQAEIIQDGDTGLLIAPKDVGALANALLRLFHDEKLAMHLTSNAYRLLEESFNQHYWLAEAEKYLCEIADKGRRKNDRH